MSAQAAFRSALDTIEQLPADELTNKMKALRVTCKFNDACLHENLFQLDLASNAYKAIIEECPDYIDAYHRLAYLARQRGDYERAL